MRNTLTDLIQWLTSHATKTCQIKRIKHAHHWAQVDADGFPQLTFERLELQDVTFKVKGYDTFCGEWMAWADGKPMLPNQPRPVAVARKIVFEAKRKSAQFIFADTKEAVSGVKYLALDEDGSAWAVQ